VSRRQRPRDLAHSTSIHRRSDFQGCAPGASSSGLQDKVFSIGMAEHVGLANMPAYLGVVQRVLRPGGLFLNHGITHDEEAWNHTVATEFINRYVFPDGEFDCVSNIQLGMERAGFEQVTAA
jgi:cyclopropane-fatty-acyl-phospholipid synthase